MTRVRVRIINPYMCKQYGKIRATLYHSYESDTDSLQSRPGASEMASPTFVSRSAFQGTLLYYIGVHVLRIVKPGEGGAIIVTLFVGHGIIAELTGWNLDWTYPFARIGHAISNTPMPELMKAIDEKTSKALPPTSKRKSKAGTPSASNSSQDLSKQA